MQEQKPPVSIIVRTKDRPELLKVALRSISAQTYRPIEVVLVNDGGCELPEDELRAILGGISLSYIKLEKNMGRSRAGNVGIENAQGTYIGFLDDDDEFYPEHVLSLVGFLEKNKCAIAYSDAELVHKDLHHTPGGTAEAGGTVLFSRPFSYEELLVGNYIPFMCILFTGTVFIPPENRFDETFDLYEDWDLLIRIAQHHPFHHYKKVTARYNYWNHEAQITRADPGQMNPMHLKVIGKHLAKITPSMVLRMRLEKENIDLLYNDRERQLSLLKEDLQQKERLLSDSVRESSKLREVAVQRENQFLGLRETVSQLNADIALMRGTFGWRLLEKARRIRNACALPCGLLKRMFHFFMPNLQQFSLQPRAGEKHRLPAGNQDMSAVPADVDPAEFTHVPSTRIYRVLFLKCAWAGITNHYRVYNMVEYLGLKNIRAAVIDLSDLPSSIPYAYQFDIVIVHRIPMNRQLRDFIDMCRELGIIVIFDIDDYIFDPSIIHLIEWVKHTKSHERHQLIKHMEQCGQTLESCRYFIGTTAFLSMKAQEMGKEAYVVRNGFSHGLLLAFSEALAAKQKGDIRSFIKIGYFSGTNTHQKDFHSIARPLVRILREYENVSLSICGLLDLDDDVFRDFTNRIERRDIVPLEQLPHALSSFDINVAPLEPGNIFCEAKSELKYVYSGMLKIPTVASPTDAFSSAITHEANGLLAATDDEWYECLKLLIENGGLRRQVGERAYEHVLHTYVPSALADSVVNVYESIITKERERNNISRNALSISFLVADTVENCDTHVHLFNIAKALRENGHFVRMYFFRSAYPLASRAHSEPPVIQGVPVIRGMENILSTDILACTDAYNSLHIAIRNRDRAAHLVYLQENKDGGPEHTGTIPDVFTIIRYSPDFREIANTIEGV